MKRKTAIAVLLILLSIFSTGASAGENISLESEGLSLADKKMVDISESVILDGSYLYPFRSTFESLGAKVDWDTETEKTILSIQGEQYVCEMIAPNSSFPDNKYFYVKNIKYGDSRLLKHHIQLNPMGAEGGYEMIDDRIYLFEDTMRRLLNHFGYELEVKTEVTVKQK